MTFNVLVTETRSKIIQIEALTEEEAITQAEEKYLAGEIALRNDDDFESVSYIVVP